MADQLFLQGINYWPIDKAMYWWKDYDLHEVDCDFTLLDRCGFKLVRIFLTWEDFQPQPDTVSPASLKNLMMTLDLAYKHDLQVMPTFFCGHMSGVNWMPTWMLGSNTPQHFDVYAGGRIYPNCRLRDCYTDREVMEAQAYQLEEICSHIHGHEALYGYDLGNENSNFAIPPNRAAARRWLDIMTTAIRGSSPGKPITIGMHSEDLEQDRHMWPQDAALYCDYLCMHGYPSYLSWVEDPLDVNVLPFLAVITEWLGNKPVLLEEFGAPTGREDVRAEAAIDCLYPLFNETEISNFYHRAIEMLHQEYTLGVLAWCFADYHPSLWNRPPLDRRFHERYFGLFRADHSPKPAVDAFSTTRLCRADRPEARQRHAWLKKHNPAQFYTAPIANLSAMYKEYLEHKGLQSGFIARSNLTP